LRSPYAALILALLIAVSHAGLYAGTPDNALEEILSSAESLFKAMRGKNHPAIWAGLSTASRKTILDETRKAIVTSTGKEVPEEELLRDFEDGGPVARGYWIGFLSHFDPNLVLEQSRWEPGKIVGDRAEILLTHKGSEKPALLKLFREEGRWKAGLVETFWGRK
jgi:hypothetical protein